jgi:hypothetical protein
MQIPRPIRRGIVSFIISDIFNRALDGHPTIFMKILHYVIFYYSGSVRNYLYSKEIDPMTIHLNDYKFMEKIMFIIVSCHKFFILTDEHFWVETKDQYSAIL